MVASGNRRNAALTGLDLQALKGRSSVLLVAIVGVVFVTLGTSRVLLMKFSSVSGAQPYAYNPLTVNVLAELIKFIVSFVLAVLAFSRRTTRHITCVQFFTLDQPAQVLKWSVPGMLYFCDNLVVFYVISSFQPAIAVLLGNFSIISTSLLFCTLLRKRLSWLQWSSLLILFFAICMLSFASPGALQNVHPHQQMPNQLASSPDGSWWRYCGNATIGLKANWSASPVRPTGVTPVVSRFALEFRHLLVLLQCFLSSLANVYNEKIFKEPATFSLHSTAHSESLFVQNTKLYFFGILFNALSLLILPSFRHQTLELGFFHDYNIYAVLLCFVTAFYGLTIALILKFLDNMFCVTLHQMVAVLLVVSSMWLLDFRPPADFFLITPVIVLVIYQFYYEKRRLAAESMPPTLAASTARAGPDVAAPRSAPPVPDAPAESRQASFLASFYGRHKMRRTCSHDTQLEQPLLFSALDELDK